MRRIFFEILVIAGGMNGVMGQTKCTDSIKPDAITICYLETHAFSNIGNNCSCDSTAYIWEQGTDGTSWSTASGINNAADYTTEKLNGDRYYRRIIFCIDKNNGDTTNRDTTNAALVTVRPRFTVSKSDTQSVCQSSTPTLTITASGGSGDYKYQWQGRTGGGGGSWSDISGGTSASYTTSQITADSYYRCVVKDSICGIDTTIYRGVKISLLSTQLSESQVICYNTVPDTLKVIASGGDGNYTYQWQNKLKNNNIWDSIIGATDSNYVPPALTDTTEYRCIVTSCNNENRNGTITVNVRPEFKAGKITVKDTAICLTASLTITADVASGGYGGVYTYRWKKNNVVISGANTANYHIQANDSNNIGNFTYTREVYDSCKDWVPCDGSCMVSVATLPDITGKTLVCSTEEPTEYSISSPISGVVYEWTLNPSHAGTIVGDGGGKISIDWVSTFNSIARLTVTAKITGCNLTSSPLSISVNPKTDIEFKEAPNPVCGNQKGLIYEIPAVASSCKWEIVGGDIVEQNTTSATVNWHPRTEGSKHSITAKFITNNDCEYVATLNVAVFPSNAPDLDSIVGKKDTDGNTYMLICPNPTNSNWVYQWYKNDTAIFTVDGKDTVYATEQFFYPPNYKTKLQENSVYTVYVAEASSVVCGNYTAPYTYKEKITPKAKYFTVSPNPVENGTFTVSFNRDLLQESTDYVLSIYSVEGKKMWEEKISGLDDITIAKIMTAGIYTITLTDNKKQYSEKIVVK